MEIWLFGGKSASLAELNRYKMEFLTLKTLTVSMLIGTAVSTSAMPAAALPQSITAQTYEVVSDTALKADTAINLPAKTVSATTVLSTLPVVKFVVPDTVSAKDKLDAWLDGLITRESNGRTDLKILDVNGHYSYGCLQFQMPTFIAYGRKYGVISGNEDNLGTLIMSCSLQRNIAKKMILDNSANWRHWYTSVAIKNLGLPPVD
jgi:hypothetical protein